MVFIADIPEHEIRKERETARELRKSSWWKRKCAEGKCYYCNAKVPAKELTMDHIVPIIRGGKCSKGNIVTACKQCNNKKKYLLPIEWEEYLAKLNIEEC
jgi:5-methylcytosine-specific restriction endonuclease McrA